MDTRRAAARANGEPTIIGLPREQAILLPKEAFKLRERRLWSFATNQVAGVTIQLDNKPTQFVRLPNSTWRSADNEELDQIQSAMLEETIYRMGVLFAIGWVAEGEAAMEATGIQLGANQLTAEVDTAGRPEAVPTRVRRQRPARPHAGDDRPIRHADHLLRPERVHQHLLRRPPNPRPGQALIALPHNTKNTLMLLTFFMFFLKNNPLGENKRHNNGE